MGDSMEVPAVKQTQAHRQQQLLLLLLRQLQLNQPQLQQPLQLPRVQQQQVTSIIQQQLLAQLQTHPHLNL